jgi:phosphatidylinositol alpha-1,6-mannosyltransferase
MKLRGARVAVFLHGVEVWQPLTRIRRYALQIADLLIANSSYTANRFRHANPWTADRPIMVCPLGIGSPDQAPQPQECSPPLVLIVGRMAVEERYKGHDRLLECWPLVRSAIADAHLCIVGDGNDRMRLEHKCRTLGVSESVRFAGRIPDSDLEQLYRRCSLFVMPSRNEGFGLVFLEAMRAGRPCIAGDGAPREVVQDGVTGLIDSTTDAAGLARTIVQLLQDPALRARMGQAGFERYCREFTALAFSRRLRIDLAVEDVGRTQ